MSNHLAGESSPYLLQHADNPVDWYPWGEEALGKAKREDKPIFLSIGYSACHWCHVMAHESFEDEDVAEILNRYFVSIKVDREERPDLDNIYMSAVQAMTGSGGWPMSVFLTPDGQPFYGGTYFPPESRYGMPSFTEVLRAVIDAWQNRRQETLTSGEKVAAVLQQQQSPGGEDDGELHPETLTRAVETLWDNFDPLNGGWGGSPKFPQPMIIEFLLRRHIAGNQQALEMVTQTLDAMAMGGMFDQLGGGFHRYSVDNRWLVPHFEKMLYDNAQLARVYLHAWQVTGDDFYRKITEETLDYVLREMTDPAGGFYATQDADSEGREGAFFLWTPDQIREVLGDEAEAFMEAYGVSESGNFEGENILEFVGAMEERETFETARQKLFQAREKRPHPGKDEKAITSWNGLMLAAFAEAGRVLDRQAYRQAAVENGEFLLDQLRTPNGRLLHVWKDGQAKVNGYLEDYTYLIEGLIELYQTTFEPRWYTAAADFAETILTHFKDPEGGFFETSDDHEDLILRPKNLQDNAVPSGSAMAVFTLLRLSGLALEPDYLERAQQSLATMQAVMAKYPLGFGQWLQALDHALGAHREIAIIGDPQAEDTAAILAASREGFRPHQVVALRPAQEETPIPVLQHREQIDDRATAYVCENFTCRPPITDVEKLKQFH
jgi:hypothetical protein